MLFFFVCAAFALFPREVLLGAQNGLRLCIDAVIPSLLPFMVVSGCIIKSQFSRPLGAVLSKVITPLTGISSAGCVCFVTGLTGGYGAGARAVLESYREKLISKEEAERLLPLCNNAGPLFIIGTVGVSFYGSQSVGAGLFLVQIITAIICARLFSGGYKNECALKDEWNFYKKNKLPTGELVVKSSIESGSAIINACVFVILFSALLEVLPFGEYKFLGGILEVTRGCSEMSMVKNSLPVTSAFLAWGGISVHLQADALCSGTFDMKRYYTEKIFAAVCAFFVAEVTSGDISLLLATIVLVSGMFLILQILAQGFSRQLLFRQRRRS